MFKPKPGKRLEGHMLKAHAIGCLNRDDSGRPKSAMIGGRRRGRQSSQTKKYSIRQSEVFDDFRDYANVQYGAVKMLRTRKIVKKVQEEIEKRIASTGHDFADFEKEISETLSSLPSLFSKNESKGKVETQILTFSEDDVKKLAKRIVSIKGKKIKIESYEKFKKIMKGKRITGELCPELQLFSRFSTALDVMENIDSPLQVAHAFTVHEMTIERDYWTAVDDFVDDFGRSGSAHINARMFGAGVYYSYFCVDIPLLAKNIQKSFADALDTLQQVELTGDLISAFLFSALCSNPVGGQTGYANNDMPETVLLTYSGTFPHSAAPAFEKPVLADRNGGYLQPAKYRLKKWIAERYKRYGLFCGSDACMGLADNTDTDLDSLVEWAVSETSAAVRAAIGE